MPLHFPDSESFALLNEKPKGFVKKHDADGKGYLSKEERKKGFEELHSRGPAWRARPGLRHADGSISLDQELHHVVSYAFDNRSSIWKYQTVRNIHHYYTNK
ncbi:putative Calcium-binding EF-hand family protein [Melia azedarach]|uniref:Calcium-binding EF-hand family protein n=1 Tax=Melia azedarach TaxID=155640 RepID=A0ACC1WRB8_MELAZ|nr:putative Calcium-binding EF-hand family protein [Melia azedarach]